jgi:hypothetical protein
MTTVGGRIRSVVVTTALFGERVYREGSVPEQATFPYCVFVDPISEVPQLKGDARIIGRRRLVQLDVWQEEGEGFDPTLADQLVAAIDGAVLPQAGGEPRAFRASVEDRQKIDDLEVGLVHTALTVAVSTLA